VQLIAGKEILIHLFIVGQLKNVIVASQLFDVAEVQFTV